MAKTLPAKTENKVEKIDSTSLAPIEKNIADNILNRVARLEKEGGLQFPANYSYANALKSAWLILQTAVDKDKRKVLEVCTKESIANSLLDMVILGLSPMKKQGYFIAYGNILSFQRSYFGTIAIAKRVANVEDAFGTVIYEGDEFEYSFDLKTGNKIIEKHNQSFQNIDSSKIVGAYAMVLRTNKPPYYEVMNMDQIRKAWEQGPMKGKSPAHINFTDEMCKKTVLNKVCKVFINTSNDSDVLIEAFHRTSGHEYISDAVYEENLQKEIEQNANKQPIDIKQIQDKNNGNSQKGKEPEARSQKPEPESEEVGTSGSELFNQPEF